MLFRASPIDSILRSASAPLSEADLEKYHAIASLQSEDRGPSPLHRLSLFASEISRPSSTSTQGSSHNFLLHQPQQYHHGSLNLSAGGEILQHQHKPSLPGLSSLTSLTATPPGPIRSFSSNAATPSMNYATSSPAPTPGVSGSAVPVCQNCQTSTTPLWRRDEAGSVLCNACGLFLKLHGRPRPISLKTDVIKSRNRVKSANQGPKKKFETNGLPASQTEFATPQNGANAHRRVSQMASSAASDRSHSPISRTNTPNMQQDPNIAPQHLFDGVTLNDQAFHASPSLPTLHLGQPSPGSTSSMNDRHLEPPQSYDQLIAANTNLRTRVTELEVINMMYLESETGLRRERDAAMRKEDELKRRIHELEHQLHEAEINSQHPSKKLRLSDVTNEE